MADAADLKSASRKRVGVRVPSSAPQKLHDERAWLCAKPFSLYLKRIVELDRGFALGRNHPHPNLLPIKGEGTMRDLRHTHYLVHDVDADRLAPGCKELLCDVAGLAVRDRAIINLSHGKNARTCP